MIALDDARILPASYCLHDDVCQNVSFKECDVFVFVSLDLSTKCFSFTREEKETSHNNNIMERIERSQCTSSIFL